MQGSANLSVARHLVLLGGVRPDVSVASSLLAGLVRTQAASVRLLFGVGAQVNFVIRRAKSLVLAVRTVVPACPRANRDVLI
jgi:hypothetical protein